MGDSIGKWEGNTLVVDTIDLNGDVWLGIAMAGSLPKNCM